MKLKFKTLIFFSLLFLVLFFLSSCSDSCTNPLRCSIQSKLEKIDINPLPANDKAVVQILYSGSNTCTCSINVGEEYDFYDDGKKERLYVYSNNCGANKKPVCNSKLESETIDGESVNYFLPTCSCVNDNSNTASDNTCVDNDKSDDVCDFGGCGPDFRGNTVKCKFCTNDCGETYGTGECVSCTPPGSCSCEYSNEEGSWNVNSDNCNSGYTASCRTDGSCVCASDEE